MAVRGNMRANLAPIAHSGERSWGDSLVYDLARFLGSPFSYDVAGFENITTPGPAIFVCNHLGALGPLEAILSVPIRFYPWIISEMLDFKQAPEYLYNDFIHPELHLNGRFGLLFSTLLSKISIRLLNSIGSISIDRFGGLSIDGFRHSLRLLRGGKNLLIFPEDALLPLDSFTLMRHFMPGFATLCSLFQLDTGSSLPVYPMAVHAGNETVAIGKAQFLDPFGRHRQAIDHFCQSVETCVLNLYLELQKNSDEL